MAAIDINGDQRGTEEEMQVEGLLAMEDASGELLHSEHFLAPRQSRLACACTGRNVSQASRVILRFLNPLLIFLGSTLVSAYPAGAQGTLCRESAAISAAAEAQRYTETGLWERMTAWCKPGDLIELRAQQAALLCNFDKQIVQEGNGNVVCVMASPRAEETPEPTTEER